MSGVVAKRVARSSAAQGRQRTGAPFNVVGRPAAPTQRSREIGWSMMPRTGRPLWASAINVPNSGTPLIKDLVPSIGSSTQTSSASSRTRPYSSPIIPCAGNRASINCRIAASAARSAMVTGVRSGLSSTSIAVRKCGRIAAPAASANWAASAKQASRSGGIGSYLPGPAGAAGIPRRPSPCVPVPCTYPSLPRGWRGGEGVDGTAADPPFRRQRAYLPETCGVMSG